MKSTKKLINFIFQSNFFIYLLYYINHIVNIRFHNNIQKPVFKRGKSSGYSNINNFKISEENYGNLRHLNSNENNLHYKARNYG